VGVQLHKKNNMEMKDITTEEIMATRFNLANEYDAIKALLLQKINRMEAIENEIKTIDDEINLRSQSKK
jgi:hypothetical protein